MYTTTLEPAFSLPPLYTSFTVHSIRLSLRRAPAPRSLLTLLHLARLLRTGDYVLSLHLPRLS